MKKQFRNFQIFLLGLFLRAPECNSSPLHSFLTFYSQRNKQTSLPFHVIMVVNKISIDPKITTQHLQLFDVVVIAINS